MIKVFFGAPGCGKSTAIAYLVSKHIKKFNKAKRKKKSYCYDYIFTNTDVDNANKFNKKQLDKMAFPPKSLVLIDEAGLEFNSRKTLSLTDGMQYYLKKHRHYQNDLYFFSQTWEDIDVVVSRLAVEVWHLKKLGPFTLVRRILKDADVNDDTHKIEDMYKKERLYKRFLPYPFGSFSFFLIYRPKYYNMFNSWEIDYRPFIKGHTISSMSA